MTLAVFIPCAKLIGAVVLAKVVWWLVADFVLDSVDLPLV
jgi:hypothetical protein